MNKIKVDDLEFNEGDIKELLLALADCIQELEELKSNCWCKKSMRLGCWENDGKT